MRRYNRKVFQPFSGLSQGFQVRRIKVELALKSNHPMFPRTSPRASLKPSRFSVGSGVSPSQSRKYPPAAAADEPEASAFPEKL
jgi:hypothetical protein